MRHNSPRPAASSTTPALPATLAACGWLDELFDRVDDIVFFVKDRAGRYLLVNRTLVERCGLTDKRQIIGRSAVEVFPPPLGERYLAQDRAVCATGAPIVARLELHLFPGRHEGWCLTDKVPLRDASGAVIGLAGLSRDLRVPREGEAGLAAVARAVAHLQTNLSDDLRVERLAARAGLSAYQFNRRIRAVFGVTARQLVAKTRIDAALRQLRATAGSIAAIAAACGYSDQSAFTRQFKSTVGLTPRQYRARFLPPLR